MNGPHDLGGQMGFGAVAPELDEPVFHATWEARSLALTLAVGSLGHWNIDISRHARESLPPAVYYGSTYYEIWARALEQLLMDADLVGADELAAGRALHPPAITNHPTLRVENVAAMLASGSPYTRDVSQPARFAAGQHVRTINDHPTGHTRLPRYARNADGTIERVVGCFVHPDANALGAPNPTWLYTVVFRAADLWGRSADPNSTVSIDAFEPYLEPALEPVR